VLRRTEDRRPGIRLFEFAIPDLDRFEYVAGQWVSLVAEVDGKPVTRAYSLASLPSGNTFEICLNLVEDGLFTPYLFGLSVGAAVTVRGPVGSFVLRGREREAVFVATGTGVVPFRPMLRQAGYLEQGAKATLIFGARYESGLVFGEEFSELAALHSNFRFIPTVTRPSESWAGTVGRVQPLLWNLLGDRTDVDVYVCGLKEMVDDVRQGLKDRGFDRKQIIYEKYD
jgi:ferredoxin-NADP reductase